MEIFSKRQIISVFFLLQVSCSNSPVISELTNDRMTIVLKSTYASGTDYAWYNFHESDSYVDTTGNITFSDGGLPAAYADAKFYIDFAELRLATGTGKPSGTLPEDYWEYPAQKRLLFCSDNTALFSRELLTCKDQGGANQLSSFFDNGITLTSEDIKSGTYPHLGLFFRKLVTYPAKLYDNGTLTSDLTTTFDNRQILGLDVEPYYQQSPGSTSTVPLLFPLELTNLNLQIPGSNKPFVLEVRVLLKNAIMKHIIKEADNYLAFLGPSDIVNNHNYTSTTEATQLGGNLLFTARVYEPDDIGSIEISNYGTVNANSDYFALMPAGDTFDPTASPGLPYAAVAAKISGVTPKIDNLPAGSYDLYVVCDKKRNNGSGPGSQTGTDGYPETKDSCATSISVTAGSTTQADADSCTCP